MYITHGCSMFSERSENCSFYLAVFYYWFIFFCVIRQFTFVAKDIIAISVTAFSFQLTPHIRTVHTAILNTAIDLTNFRCCRTAFWENSKRLENIRFAYSSRCYWLALINWTDRYEVLPSSSMLRSVAYAVGKMPRCLVRRLIPASIDNDELNNVTP